MTNFYYQLCKEFKQNTQFIGECEHLWCMDIHSEDCLKRYFTVYDPIQGNARRIAFCNDYLKLQIKSLLQNQYAHEIDSKQYLSELEGIVLTTLHLKQYQYFYRSDSDPLGCVMLTICERPNILIFVPMKTAISWYYDNGSHLLLDPITSNIERWANQNNRYKKHKSTCEKIFVMLRKLKRTFGDDVVRVSTFNEIILFIHQIFYNEAN